MGITQVAPNGKFKGYKSKNQMMWEVGKELEEEILKEVFSIRDMETKDMFKLIRSTEFRRGKEETKKELLQELSLKLVYFEDCRECLNTKLVMEELKKEIGETK